MSRLRSHLLRSACLASAAVATIAGVGTAGAAPTFDLPGLGSSSGVGGTTYAVIGDVPYGAAQIATFPKWIDQINADPAVSFTFHLGDIKNGSSVCSDAYFGQIRTQFDRFRKPFIYTPGDNEWTDCHRPDNGAYNPVERLGKVRQVFFDRPGRTLGQQSIPVASQAGVGIPENVSLTRDGVAMATLHVVGSNDDLKPWTGIGKTAATPEQIAEEKQRIGAAIALVRSTFAQARLRNQRAVAFYTQADMFDPTYDVTQADDSAFTPLVRTLAQESRAFGKPVYLFNGDSHVYNADNPLAAGSKWLAFYGVAQSADNLKRVTVDGSSNNKDYLRVTIARPGSPEVLTWQRVPYTVQAG
ncbi:MAG: metallophosphoesterase [Williamsia herbipolensis]|nr:metallophosphoesterase [Williamsia herbipolensis]